MLYIESELLEVNTSKEIFEYLKIFMDILGKYLAYSIDL